MSGVTIERNRGAERAMCEGNDSGASGTDEALRRLEELRIGEDEPDLSAEQIRSNAQLQEDELLALEAICGENIVILDRIGDLLPLQMYVHCEIPDGLIVSAKLQSSSEKLNRGGKDGDVMETSDDSDEFLYKFKVRYLPPIVLTCLLPQSYPSHKPPDYTISVKWLDTQKISILCHMLDSIWSEQPGLEVIYQWVDWLQSSARSYLGFDNEMILGPYDMSESGDLRAISGLDTLEADIPSLIGYNDKKHHGVFLNTPHQCFICFGYHAGAYFIKLPCQHFFCQKCMEAYCTMHVKEGSIISLLCPDAKCGRLLPPAVLKQLLEDGDFKRWESLLLQKTLDSMADVVYCPRCRTPCLEDKDHHAQCQKCYFSFCTKCRTCRHVGSKCLSMDEKLELLQKSFEASSQELDLWRQQNRPGSSHIKYDRKYKEQEIINEILSIREVLSDSKQCPRCKMAISRSHGCNKMVCTHCGEHFCYICNEAIFGYGHFKRGCKLYSEEEIDIFDENQIQEPEPIVNEPVEPELQTRPGHPCPYCGQHSAKAGNNNHIFCRSCLNHFCALCRKIVKKSSDHFGPKGCKQHTADL